MDQLGGFVSARLLFATGLFLAAAKWIALDLHEVAEWLAPHRHAWYALPMVMLAFVASRCFPVVLLIAATGIAFGPVLGPVYAMAGCLASGRLASRSAGGWGGSASNDSAVSGLPVSPAAEAQWHARRLSRSQGARSLHLVNIVVGASTVGYRDFVIGTLLGMGAYGHRPCWFGYSYDGAAQSIAREVIAAALFISVPLTLAWLINRARGRTEAG